MDGICNVFLNWNDDVALLKVVNTIEDKIGRGGSGSGMRMGCEERGVRRRRRGREVRLGAF
ncbi:hypothetical protein IKQ19_01360 [Candidatus Saccharibacteria bacterium]|nr:hypothetical protein [Candidatus Saccharibacteria bacterium]